VKIRPLKTQNKKEVSRLLRQAKTFSDQEIQVALEVVDDALRRPEKLLQDTSVLALSR